MPVALPSPAPQAGPGDENRRQDGERERERNENRRQDRARGAKARTTGSVELLADVGSCTGPVALVGKLCVCVHVCM